MQECQVCIGVAVSLLQKSVQSRNPVNQTKKKFRSSAEKSNETNLGVRLHFLLLERMISAVSFPTWFQFIFFVGEESARTKVIVGSFEPSASASLANVAP